MVSKATVSFYHSLPYQLRCAMAGARGLWLSRWRYGPGADDQAAEFLSHDIWTEEQWRVWREEALARVLHRARTSIPWYRDHWDTRRRKGDMSSPELLANWPILEKDDVRLNPLGFLADDADRRSMYQIRTSGTTGKPIQFYQSRRTVQRQYALTEARMKRWNGVTHLDRWAHLGGQLVAPVAQKNPPFWVKSFGLHKLYMSSIHLSIATAPSYYQELLRFKPAYLLGFPSAIHTLAAGMIAASLPPPGLNVVITDSEPLLDYQRELIERAFACPVVETYGQTENMLMASQCSHGRMHLWPESGCLEVLADGLPVPNGEIGDFIVTGLNNPDMPFIRYRVGDRGAIGVSGSGCSCGRTLPYLSSIIGRIDDVVVTRDGRQISRLDPALRIEAPLVEAQVVQESFELLRVRCVVGAGWNKEHEALIAGNIRDRMGPVRVEFELVDRIQRGANNKFKFLTSRLTPEERAQAIRCEPISNSEYA